VSPRGEIMAEASATLDDIALADVDLSALPTLRSLWGYYRDRRPDKYGPVVELPSGALHPTGASIS
jgi:beta-ureidopropionase